MISHKQNSAMKTLSRIFLTAIFFAITLVSCGKITPAGGDTPGDDIPGGNTEQEAVTRIVTVSFGTKATRTTFDGKDYDAPHFEVGDMIRVWKSDGSEYKDLSVKKKDNQDIYYIELPEGYTGDLPAVYPAKYATEDPSDPFYVPYFQTGKYADANICTATIPGVKNPTAEFKNETAVFVIELPDLPNNRAQIQCLVVTSLGWIDNTTGQRGETRARISNDGEEDEYSIMLDYMYDEDEHQVYYPNPLFVSVLCDTDGTNGPVYLADLNFDINYYLKDDEGGDECDDIYAMGGFSPKFLGYMSDRTVSPNDIYTGVEDHLHEYINFGNVKWATMNVGATSTDRSSLDSYGLYFAWGETTGHKWNGEKFEPLDGKSGYSFDWGSGYLSMTLDDDIKNDLCPILYSERLKKNYNVLSLKYDAAYQNWGGAWRMPRYDDSLYPAGENYMVTDYIADSVRGKIDFANVGYGTGTSRTVPTGGTAPSTYWTSTLSAAMIAYYVSVNSTSKITISNNSTYGYRYIGHVIRPVSSANE